MSQPHFYNAIIDDHTLFKNTVHKRAFTKAKYIKMLAAAQL